MNEFRRIAVVALAGAALAGTYGCGSKNSIVGKWQSAPATPNSQAGPTVFEFKPDGTEVMTISVGTMTAVVKAKYVVNGDSLQMTPSTMTLNGQTMPVPGQMAGAKTTAFKLDGDTLTMTPPGSSTPTTFKRMSQ